MEALPYAGTPAHGRVGKTVVILLTILENVPKIASNVSDSAQELFRQERGKQRLQEMDCAAIARLHASC